MRCTASCILSPATTEGVACTRLSDNGLGSRLNARHFDLVTQEHVRYLWVQVVLPIVTLIDCFIQPRPLFLTLKATDPDIQIVFFLPHEAPENDHAFRDLERNDLFFHKLHPFFTLPRLRTILP